MKRINNGLRVAADEGPKPATIMVGAGTIVDVANGGLAADGRRTEGPDDREAQRVHGGSGQCASRVRDSTTRTGIGDR